jgi:hypothetical protein
MVVISWFSISLSYSSWLSFSLAIAIAMMAVTTISSIAMMVISWLSYSSSKEGKGNSKLKQFKVIKMFTLVESNEYYKCLIVLTKRFIFLLVSTPVKHKCFLTESTFYSQHNNVSKVHLQGDKMLQFRGWTNKGAQ